MSSNLDKFKPGSSGLVENSRTAGLSILCRPLTMDMTSGPICWGGPACGVENEGLRSFQRDDYA